MEVSPEAAQKHDVFVHVIEVGDKGELKAMHDAHIDAKGSTLQVRVDLGDKRSVVLSFAQKDPTKGDIEMFAKEQSLFKEVFTTAVQRQNRVDGSFVE